ncbi:MAG: Fis family transcriptional regulator [Methylotenera sp.]|nr:MAG: Fis family transcriptional regulator [Methylotenera sp.]
MLKMLTQARLKELLHYSPDTGLFTRKSTVGGKLIGSSAGAHDTSGHLQIKIDSRLYLAHRLAWLFVHGNLPAKQIDHINGIRDDNRFENLREASFKQNMQNQKKPRTTNSTGFLGVSFHKPNSLYRAQICHNKKVLHLGYHRTPEEAHQAYLAAKRNLHEFNTL